MPLVVRCSNCEFCFDRTQDLTLNDNTRSILGDEKYAPYRFECRRHGPVSGVDRDGEQIPPFPHTSIESGFCGDGENRP